MEKANSACITGDKKGPYPMIAGEVAEESHLMITLSDAMAC